MFRKPFDHLRVRHSCEIHHRLGTALAEPTLVLRGHGVPGLVAGLGDRNGEALTRHETYSYV